MILSSSTRKTTPTIIQLDPSECGAVCLQIILAYYEKFVPIAELRKSCAVTKSGTNPDDIIKAASEYQLDAQLLKIDLDSMQKIKLPVIIDWKGKSFAILEGIKNDKVYINDPAYGPKQISLKQFTKLSSGVVIQLVPNSGFVRSGTAYSPMPTLLKYIRPFGTAFILTGLTSFALIFLTIAFAASNQVFIDQFLIKRMTDWKEGFLFIVLLLTFLTSSVTFIQEYILNRLQAAISIKLGKDFIQKTLRLPLSFYLQRSPGEIAYRVTLIDNICSTLTDTLSTGVANLVLVALYGILLFWYDVYLAATGILLFGGHYAILWWTYRSRFDALSRYQAAISKSNSVSQSAIENIESIKACCFEYNFFSNWAGEYTKVLNSLTEIGKRDVILNNIPDLLEALSITLVTGIGVYRIIDGHLTIGMFVAANIILSNFIKPLKTLLEFGPNIQLFKVNIYRLDDVLNNVEDPLYQNYDYPASDIEKSTPVSSCISTISLDFVSFKYYPTKPPIVEDISFILNTGKSVALVGKSGCGKTTIAKLICRLLPISSGSLQLNNIPIEKIPYDQIVKSIGYVDQEPFFFAGTVFENLTLLDDTFLEEDVVRATSIACIHDEILLLKEEYQHLVVEGGKNFSGGQRQRLEIARNLIKNPTFLIMDEGTSALDYETETKIMKNIRKQGIGLLVIAHRLNTIQNCDEIIVIDNGKIVGRGTHDELLETQRLYNELVASEMI